ncbi:MAG: ABC transporter ATP-binding protein [Dehalococcoidia bacterium]|nr:ABC transporter ATP-binding protein [Dehalococcoidia bacterium]
MTDPIISVRNLSVRYRTKDDVVHAVDDVSFDLQRGEVYTLIGESGAGKSTVAMSILRLLAPAAELLGGEVHYAGMNLLAMDERELRALRGRRIAMIFQDPVAGLNPVLTVGSQVEEMLTSHLEIGKKEARKRALEILYDVGLSDPARVAKSYPFQLSGGMCQRVMIGIATALDPEVLVADEPTSALDVTVQAQIFYQLARLRESRGTSILLITHDFGVVAQAADQVGVMYGGRLVETGGVVEMMKSPLHPYTHALLGTLPRINESQHHLAAIPGSPPELNAPAGHCAFAPRCLKALSICKSEPPPPLTAGESRSHPVACYNPIWQG